MGCKQPGEPLRRGVNKGISQTVSELVPAGRRNGTIPIPAHNREQHYPTARLGKQETKGKGLLQGTAPACQGDSVVGTVSPSAGGGSGTGLGQAQITPRLLLHLLLAAKVRVFPAVPGQEPS